MAKETEEKRVVPVKNYVILGVLFIAVIALVFYLCNLYHVYDEAQREIPVIRDTLYEIQPEELEHYVMENPTTAIYMCTASADACRNYEKNLKKLVNKEDLKESLIYLNLSSVDQNEFVDKFNARYPYKIGLTKNYPAVIVFEDGKVDGILQGKENRNLTIAKTEQFIELHQIGKQGE